MKFPQILKVTNKIFLIKKKITTNFYKIGEISKNIFNNINKIKNQ